MFKFRNDLFAFLVFCCSIFFGGTKAHSAPFCIEQEGVPAECLYQDSSSCWREATKRKGFCSVNLKEVAVRQRDNSFCIIDSSMVPVCGYQSAESCREAAKQNGVCFKNENGNDSSDPYRFDRALFRTN
jgi:hypothetical protein